MVQLLLSFLQDVCGNTKEAFKNIQVFGEKYKNQIIGYAKLWAQRLPHEIYFNRYGHILEENIRVNGLLYQFKVHHGTINRGDVPICTFNQVSTIDECYRGWQFHFQCITLTLFVETRPENAIIGMPEVLSPEELAIELQYFEEELPSTVATYLQTLTISESEIQSKLERNNNGTLYS